MRLACDGCPKLVRCGDCPQVTIDEAIATANIEVEDADHPADIAVHDEHLDDVLHGDPED